MEVGQDFAKTETIEDCSLIQNIQCRELDWRRRKEQFNILGYGNEHPNPGKN